MTATLVNHTPITSAAAVNRSLLSSFLIARARRRGVSSSHGSPVRELRVRTGAHRGAGLRDRACAPAEGPWRFDRFLHPVLACVTRVQRHERIESGFDDRLDLRCRKRRDAILHCARIARRNGLAGDSAPGASSLRSSVASAAADKFLIRHRKGSRSRRVRERRSQTGACTRSGIA